MQNLAGYTSSLFFIFLICNLNITVATEFCSQEPVVTTPNTRTDRPPNIVVLYSDDAGYADFGFQPNVADDMKELTPRIDSIAKDGARFTNAYMSGCVCSPSRAGLMTGRYQGRFGFDNNLPPATQNGLSLDETFASKRLQKLGYRTGLVGKWHLGYPEAFQPNQRGWDWFYGCLQGSRSFYPIKNPSPHRVILENSTPTKETGYVTDRFGDAACRFIKENKDRPFFLFVSFTAPHSPLQMKKTDHDRVAHIENKKRRNYAGLVVSLDDNVGKILDALKENDLDDSTLVLFTNDNGGQTLTGANNTPLRGKKGTFFEGGVRVPWAMKWPGKIKTGSVVDETVVALDLLPTFVNIAGGSIKDDWKLDGTDLTSLIKSETAKLPPRPIFWRKDGADGTYAIREGKWKLISERNKPLQLYDLESDIPETNNVSEQHPELTKSLKSKIDDWSKGLVEPRWVWGKKKPKPKQDPPKQEKTTTVQPFGTKFPRLDSLARGNWWEAKPGKRYSMNMDVPRDQVVAFALYTHDHGHLKISAQLFPLKPGESQRVRLQLQQDDGTWKRAAMTQIINPGWSAHFRISNWDNKKSVKYRIRHGEDAMFEGLIRRDPTDKNEIVVGSLSCNSSRSPGPRTKIVENLKHLDPDLLFFAGDQSYHHTQHTYGWLEFGMQFRDVLKDRPVVTIPDDHDVGQANIWGEGGIKATHSNGPSGGYFYPPAYVKMVERCQTWHLPDPHDSTPIKRGIGVYYTDLTVGGINFAILEDRKFKSGPEGKIPQMGPRPDHITDPNYERASVDLPELKLLGERQLEFLNQWSQDWTGAEMKCVLSQTAFCGAVHLHGSKENRLLADLDSNAWPQTGRNKALKEIRKAWAVHLCGDQHLGSVVKHGIENHGDGPYGFTSPAIVNTIYGRWWWPENEEAGDNSVVDSPLPWTGEFVDGLGNRINMVAYANPPNTKVEGGRGDGFGIARFNKTTQEITFECWPRFSSASKGDGEQYPGWPVRFKYRENDGRAPAGYLPELIVKNFDRPVIQVIDEATNEVLYTIRSQTNRFRPPAYAKSTYTVKIGENKPDAWEQSGIAVSENPEKVIEVRLDLN